MGFLRAAKPSGSGRAQFLGLAFALEVLRSECVLPDGHKATGSPSGQCEAS